MARVEKDLGRRLEWAAVNHHDTGHAHAHVVVRGVDRDGRELRLDRGYISNGLRWRAQELATEELGPRLARDLDRTRQREITQERFTSLDRDLERRAEDGRIEAPALRGPNRPLLVARLEQLEHFGLAERTNAAAWTLADGWQKQLRDLGARGDIVKQMHLAMRGDPSRYRIVRPGDELPTPVTGRVVAKGLSDEIKGTFYAVVESPSGQGYHLPIDARCADALRVGDVVRLSTRPESAVRPVDQAIAERAAAQGGVIALERSPEGKVSGAERRLSELERLGLVSRHGERAWKVPTDLAARLEDRATSAAPRHRLLLEKEPMGLDAQGRHRGPVWLDRVCAESLAPYGFGAEVRRLIEQRREVMPRLEVRADGPERDDKLRELEVRAIGRKMAASTGQRFVEVPPSGFRGRLQVLEGGSAGPGYAVVSDGSAFVVVAATPTVRACHGQMATVSRDPAGRIVVRNALERERGS
jgi:hypothetical protein